MITFVFYDPATGAITGHGHCMEEHFPPTHTYGFGIAKGEGDPTTHRVDVTADPPVIVPA